MSEDGRDVASRLQQAEREELREHPRPPRRSVRTVHYTELTPVRPGDRCEVEWEVYRREVGRLLAEGHAGKWLIIKGEDILGLWGTLEEAQQAERSQQDRVFLKQVLEREPIHRIGYNRQCRD
jgi:hypothetical protein